METIETYGKTIQVDESGTMTPTKNTRKYIAIGIIIVVIVVVSVLIYKNSKN